MHVRTMRLVEESRGHAAHVQRGEARRAPEQFKKILSVVTSVEVSRASFNSASCVHTY